MVFGMRLRWRTIYSGKVCKGNIERYVIKMEDGCNYLLFNIDNVQYAVPIEYVAYIVSASE